MAVIAIARASLKPIKTEQLIRNNKEEVKYPSIKINMT
jgi:hypothetical protein